MTDSRCPGASIEHIKSRHRLAHEERSYHICYRILAGAMLSAPQCLEKTCLIPPRRLVGHLPASLRFFYYCPLFYCTRRVDETRGTPTACRSLGIPGPCRRLTTVLRIYSRYCLSKAVRRLLSGFPHILNIGISEIDGLKRLHSYVLYVLFVVRNSATANALAVPSYPLHTYPSCLTIVFVFVLVFIAVSLAQPMRL